MPTGPVSSREPRSARHSETCESGMSGIEAAEDDGPEIRRPCARAVICFGRAARRDIDQRRNAKRRPFHAAGSGHRYAHNVLNSTVPQLKEVGADDNAKVKGRPCLRLWVAELDCQTLWQHFLLHAAKPLELHKKFSI